MVPRPMAGRGTVKFAEVVPSTTPLQQMAVTLLKLRRVLLDEVRLLLKT